jgi:UPF0755 protein
MDRHKRRRIFAFSVVIILVGVGSIAFANKGSIRSAYEQLLGNDFAGPGVGETTITVDAGDSGEKITNKLLKAGVVKDFNATYKIILDDNPIFYPGVFVLKKQMRSIDALRILSNQDAAITNRTTLKEGLRASVLFRVLSESTGIPETDFSSFLYKPESFGLDASLPSIEGYLFPATYKFAPGASAKEILQEMVDRMNQEINAFNIKPKDVHRILTLASIVQKEVRIKEDFYKASRVFLNRLETGMPLQSDATVSYGVGGNTFSTSKKDRADKNPYNTYVYAGLPIGPISAPGSVAIDAVINPAAGKWLYFCTINLETGETVFSETLAQHEVAVSRWLAWMKDNPSYE